jgi:hypothetical protein
MNKFVLTAVVTGDWMYFGGGLRLLTVLIQDGERKKEVLITFNEDHGTLPPGEDLEYGEEIQIEGRFAVDDNNGGRLVPVVTDITRTAEGDEDGEGAA